MGRSSLTFIPVVALAALAIHCQSGANGFECAQDDECGADGRCEASGFCSFPDQSCESGHRYGEHAMDLSSQCTLPDMPTGMPVPGETSGDSDPEPEPDEPDPSDGGSSSDDGGESTGGEDTLPDGTTYYIATNGSDDAPGTLEEPFASFSHAIAALEPGDTLLVRGGTYDLDAPVVLDATGTDDAPLAIWGYDGERPILDFASNPRHGDPPQPRDDDSIGATLNAVGLFVAGDAEHWHVRDLELRNAPYYGVRVYGSNNVFERLVLHDHKASGLEITGKDGWSPHDNLVVDCDSFHNFDPQSNGEDADGFAAKFDTLGEGNVFRRTRAWSNADDGYDFWHGAPVTLEGCWSFDNGFNRPEWVDQLSGSWQGDGMGFKLGQAAGEIEMRAVVAFGNKSLGIDENGNGSVGGVRIFNATIVNNNRDGNPRQIELNDGSPHTIVNSIAFDVDGPLVVDITGPVDDDNNTWSGIGVSAADFVHLDADGLFQEATMPRNDDGRLPILGLRLSPGSDLIDAGLDVGASFIGAAPDLGAFEMER